MVNVDAPLLRRAQRTKVAAYKLVINAAVDLPPPPPIIKQMFIGNRETSCRPL